MRGRISALKIEIDSETRKFLQGWLRRQKTPVGLAKRARAMLLLADGQTYSHTSKQVGLSEPHLRKWAKRFIESGVQGIAFLEYLEQQIPAHITTIHLVLDNLSVHKGKKVQAWKALHPRFVFHYPPVHCSWMNQVEQWFSILQRKRLRIADFADKQVLAERLKAFIGEWNAIAHPFNWSSKSVAKVMAKCKPTQPDLAIAA
jgi:transposase